MQYLKSGHLKSIQFKTIIKLTENVKHK